MDSEVRALIMEKSDSLKLASVKSLKAIMDAQMIFHAGSAFRSTVCSACHG